ncbi:hypothetical protein DFQ45_11559 [Thiopseudomonas denitrificans]|uniref:Uncharacterized protein n=1 Tax=Thiopseudomonas denitrificans TaxID=1501432 RepID=A0A4R6TW52_9GAMM|nr:hypothetical protein DFQ45_11559 [Thiopseudomonas denitrificans]
MPCRLYLSLNLVYQVSSEFYAGETVCIKNSALRIRQGYVKPPQVHLAAMDGGNAVFAGAKNCLVGSRAASMPPTLYSTLPDAPETSRQPPPPSPPTPRRESCPMHGACSVSGVQVEQGFVAMDGDRELTWMYLQRPCGACTPLTPTHIHNLVSRQKNHSPCASATALNMARRLLRVSSHSLAGFESATMPAPACTCKTRSLMMAVRMAIAMSMLPFHAQ